LSLSPPNPPAPPKQCVTRRTLFERCVRWVTFCSKMMVWLATITDAIATYLAYRQSQLPSSHNPCLSSLACSDSSTTLLPHSSNSSTLTSYASPSSLYTLLHPSLLLVVGSFSVCFGALLRLWCFKALGSLFTFEITINPSHRLVTTGPYARVRHPSYTGIFLTLLGSTAVAFAPGSWLKERWLSRTTSVDHLHPWIANVSAGDSLRLSSFEFGRTVGDMLVYFLVVFWFVKVWYALRSTLRRITIEDAELHKFFGGTWETYAREVRWKLLPGVY